MSEARNDTAASTSDRRQEERPANGSPLPDKEVLQLADEAVDRLKLPAFFEEHPDYLQTVHNRLEEIDDEAVNAKVKGEMTFMALSLPLTNGIIHIGSNRRGLREAVDWARVNWIDWPDPLSILTALTLVYIVRRGWEQNRGTDNRAKWARIGERVKMFSEEALPDPA